jgi:two-component sensor histidine kinase
MIHDPISALQSRSEMLHVAELLHRIGNDYTRAILFASLRAANASSNEVRSVLNEVVNHLHAAAAMHRVLRPPSAAESADLTNTIARLCRAQSDVSEFRCRRTSRSHGMFTIIISQTSWPLPCSSALAL